DLRASLLAVKRLGVVAAAVLALALVGGKGAPAQELQANCVLPSQTPVWLDFADGSVPFWQEFAKPGIVALASNLLYPPKLRAAGAQPWLLVNARPYTASAAGDWWRSVTDVAGIVREVYFPAPLIYRQGPILGSRTLRTSFRNGILDFTKIGIPTSKLGLFLGFQTTQGTGGRQGLAAKPWFRSPKWQALASAHVANESKGYSLWSLRWADWSQISDC